MKEKMNLVKVEQWFDYYKKVYNIFRQNILMNKDYSGLSIQVSFFNYIPEEDYDYYGKGQYVKLELLNNQKPIVDIALKTTDSEEQLFQYVWILVVNHFINQNYLKNSKIRVQEFENSTRSFKYLVSDVKQNNIPISRANFALTYNKQEYDEMLHELVRNHNNYSNQGNDINDVLVQNVRRYIEKNVDVKVSTEFDSSLNKSKKVYERLLYNSYRNAA